MNEYHRNAWIDPNGVIYPVPDDCMHDSTAWDIIERLNMRVSEQYGSDALFNRGWIEVSAHMPAYVFTPNKTLTQAQLDTLWDMYLDAKTLTQTRYVKDAITGLRSILNITVTEG
jgi:hypothetical protein